MNLLAATSEHDLIVAVLVLAAIALLIFHREAMSLTDPKGNQ